MPTTSPYARALLMLPLLTLPALGAAEPVAPSNLADHHPATASSSQGRSTPDLAVDGNPGTRWIAANSKAPAWWMVDLGQPSALGGCQITWDRDNIFQYTVEGSLDAKTWITLNDQLGSERSAQVQRLAIKNVTARYVRISIAKIGNNGWPSIAEVQVLSAEAMKLLAPDDLKLYVSDEPYVENIALNKLALASSTYNEARTAKAAFDGDSRTSWCADGPTQPQWLEVDLEEPKNLDTIQIHWESSKAAYRFVVEGSLDNIEWQVIADQRGNTVPQQIQKFSALGKTARYLRITYTGNDQAGSWACINEVKVTQAK